MLTRYFLRGKVYELFDGCQVVLTWLTNKLSTGVLDRAKCSQTCCGDPTEGSPGAESISNLSRAIMEFDQSLF